MKRDLDLVRTILKEMENGTFDEWQSKEVEREKADKEEKRLVQHLELMIERGLIEGEVLKDRTGCARGAAVSRIKWEGYEFLEATRNETLWNKAKGEVIQRTGSLAFDAVVAWLKMKTKAALGIPDFDV